jgi:hypothetical protein
MNARFIVCFSLKVYKPTLAFYFGDEFIIVYMENFKAEGVDLLLKKVYSGDAWRMKVIQQVREPQGIGRHLHRSKCLSQRRW